MLYMCEIKLRDFAEYSVIYICTRLEAEYYNTIINNVKILKEKFEALRENQFSTVSFCVLLRFLKYHIKNVIILNRRQCDSLHFVTVL